MHSNDVGCFCCLVSFDVRRNIPSKTFQMITRLQSSSGYVQPRRRRTAPLRRSARIAEKLSVSKSTSLVHPTGGKRKRTTSLAVKKRKKVQSRNPSLPAALPTVATLSERLTNWTAVESTDGVIGLCQTIATTNRFYVLKQRRFGVSQGVSLRASQMLGRCLAKYPFRGLDLTFRVRGQVDRISPYHCRVYRAFYTPITRIQDLRDLRIDLNGVVLDLSKLPPLLETLRLNVSASGMERRCLPSLAKFLRRTKSLTKLELTNWSFDEESMRTLALGNSSVTNLLIRGDQGNDCVNAFVSTWPVDSPLRQLKWLGNPTLTTLGVQELLRSTLLHPSFKFLSFEFRETAQLSVIKTIAAEMSDLRLHKLGVNATLPRSGHVSLFSEHHRLEALQAIVPAIQSNSFLHSVGVTCGGVENVNGSNVNVVYDLLEDYDFDFLWRRNRFGARYLLDAHRLADAAWCDIFAALRRDPSVLFSFLRDRPELVPKPRTEPVT